MARQPKEEVRKQEARARNKKNETRGLIPPSLLSILHAHENFKYPTHCIIGCSACVIYPRIFFKT